MSRAASAGVTAVSTPRRPSVQRIWTAEPSALIVAPSRTCSVRLRAGDAHDLAPFLRLGGDEFSEILAEGGARLGAELGEACHDVRRLEDFRHFRAELLDDRSGRARRRDEAEPGRGVEAGKPLLRDRRQLRETLWPRRARIGERP